MQADGMWTGEFATTEGAFGGGVILLNGGIVLGGDSGYSFSGVFTTDSEAKPVTLYATILVEPFIDGVQSVFRTTGMSYTLELVGKFATDDVIMGHGTSPDFPGSRISMRLSRKRVTK